MFWICGKERYSETHPDTQTALRSFRSFLSKAVRLAKLARRRDQSARFGYLEVRTKTNANLNHKKKRLRNINDVKCTDSRALSVDLRLKDNDKNSIIIRPF